MPAGMIGLRASRGSVDAFQPHPESTSLLVEGRHRAWHHCHRSDAARHAGLRHGIRCAVRAEEPLACRSRGDDGDGLWRLVTVCCGAVVAGCFDAGCDRDAGAAHTHRKHPLLPDERDTAPVVRHVARMAGLSVDAARDRRRLARRDALSRSWRGRCVVLSRRWHRAVFHLAVLGHPGLPAGRTTH